MDFKDKGLVDDLYLPTGNSSPDLELLLTGTFLPDSFGLCTIGSFFSDFFFLGTGMMCEARDSSWALVHMMCEVRDSFAILWLWQWLCNYFHLRFLQLIQFLRIMKTITRHSPHPTHPQLGLFPNNTVFYLETSPKAPSLDTFNRCWNNFPPIAQQFKTTNRPFQIS